MGKQELDNLVKIHKLKLEAPSRKEFDGMVTSARTHLADAQNEDLAPDSRFDLAMAPRTGWLSQRYAIKALTPWARTTPTSKSF